MTSLSPQIDPVDKPNDYAEVLTLLDLELDDYTIIVQEILTNIDEMLAMTAGHQIVSASEIADMVLDLRILVSKLQPKQGEPHE